MNYRLRKPAKSMKKKLNVDAIMNELRGNSAFFPGYKDNHTAQQSVKPAPKLVRDATIRTSQPVPPVRVVPPVPLVRGTTSPRRVMKQRHPFDIYQDQYETLKQLGLEERKQGGVGSMSAM